MSIQCLTNATNTSLSFQLKIHHYPEISHPTAHNLHCWYNSVRVRKKRMLNELIMQAVHL
jgi:hypothetical protein